MPKKAPEPCMFCNDTPCSCEGVKQKKSRGRKKSAAAPIVSGDSSSSDIFDPVPKQPKRTFKSGEKPPERDLSGENMLRILREIVSPRDRKRIDEMLKHPLPQELDRRVADWKARNHVG